MGVLVGYARVSTIDQRADLQADALSAAGCARVFADTGSGMIAIRTPLSTLSETSWRAPTTEAGLRWLWELFGHPAPIGSTMAGPAEELVGDPEMVAAFVDDVLAVIDSPPRSV